LVNIYLWYFNLPRHSLTRNGELNLVIFEILHITCSPPTMLKIGKNKISVFHHFVYRMITFHFNLFCRLTGLNRFFEVGSMNVWFLLCLMNFYEVNLLDSILDLFVIYLVFSASYLFSFFAEARLWIKNQDFLCIHI
jgi:hypothetical protein